VGLFAIGDLHLSLGAYKPMDVFGGKWENYVEKIRAGFSKLGPEDVCVICGDISWAMDLEGAEPDFRFVGALPGQKIILKGNHDYWWSTAGKAKARLAAWGIDHIGFLHNNCFVYGADGNAGGAAICGTRGWFYEEERGGAHDKKIMAREILRLEASLRAAGEREKLVFLHYPPKYGDYACAEILELLERYRVKLCCAGHIHSAGLRLCFEGEYRGTEHRMVSADYVNFQPVKIL